MDGTIVALIVLGPTRLPEAARQVGVVMVDAGGGTLEGEGT